jgi:hypothetical protein
MPSLGKRCQSFWCLTDLLPTPIPKLDAGFQVVTADLAALAISADTQDLRICVRIFAAIKETDRVVQLKSMGVDGQRPAMGAMWVRRPNTQSAVLQFAACHPLCAGRRRMWESHTGDIEARLECLEFHAEPLIVQLLTRI